MKVIELMSTDDYSGAENVAITIYKELEDINEMYYATRGGKIENFLKEKKVTNVIKINKLSISEIKRIEKEYKPDIIHAHDYRASVLAAIACKNATVIAHLHNNAPWLKNIFHPFTWLFLFGSFKINKILTVSNSIEKEYIFSRIIRKKLYSISNPISMKKIYEQVDDDWEKEYDVCFVGRLTKPKNPLKFIDIINELVSMKPDIVVNIIGDGELKSECIDKIKEYNIEKNVKMSGFLKNPYNEMKKSKIFCLTSEWEGYGLVAFEALALGLPAVVSKVGGLTEIVNNSCGALCLNNQEFIKEIYRMLTDNKELTRKSVEAKKRAEEISNLDEYILKLNKIYNEI